MTDIQDIQIKENKMGTMPVGKLLLEMSIPMVISMLVQSIYNVVDSIFVAQISEEALTAVSLAFPVQNILIAFGVGIGVGSSALLSRFLGENNRDRVGSVARHGVILAIILSVVFAILGLLFTNSYALAQKQNEIVTTYTIHSDHIFCRHILSNTRRKAPPSHIINQLYDDNPNIRSCPKHNPGPNFNLWPIWISKA